MLVAYIFVVIEISGLAEQLKLQKQVSCKSMMIMLYTAVMSNLRDLTIFSRINTCCLMQFQSCFIVTKMGFNKAIHAVKPHFSLYTNWQLYTYTFQDI